MKPDSSEKVTGRAIAEAWDFWLSQHPVTLGDIIEAATEKAVSRWLDEHADEVIQAIAKDRDV